MSEGERTMERLAVQFEEVESELRSLEPLDDDQATRVAELLERLQSRVLAATPPPSLAEAHERLGTKPAPADKLDELAGEMAPGDAEG